MNRKALIGTLLCLVCAALSITAWAIDEAVLTPTPERAATGSNTAESQKEKADAEKAFDAAMSIWFKHRYAEGEKLLGEFAAKYPNSRWRAEAELHQGCYYNYINQSGTDTDFGACPHFHRFPHPLNTP